MVLTFIRIARRPYLAGGEESSKDGTIFNANIPTEEVFSALQCNG